MAKSSFRINKITPLGNRTYIKQSFPSVTSWVLTGFFTSLIKGIFNICKWILWYPIKYTLGLPFVLLGKIFGK